MSPPPMMRARVVMAAATLAKTNNRHKVPSITGAEVALAPTGTTVELHNKNYPRKQANKTRTLNEEANFKRCMDEDGDWAMKLSSRGLE